MVLDGDGNRWNAHVDPASGNTYYVNERTGVSSWTLPKKGSTGVTTSSGASPLKVALGVVILAVLACFLPADSALRGAVPFSFPTLYGAASFCITPHGDILPRAGAWPRCGRCASSTSSPRCPVRLRCPFALCSSSRRLGVLPRLGVLTLCVARGPRRTPSAPTRATAGAPSAERLLEAVSTRHLPDAATAAGGSASKTKLAGAAVVGLVCFPRPLSQSS